MRELSFGSLWTTSDRSSSKSAMAHFHCPMAVWLPVQAASKKFSWSIRLGDSAMVDEMV